MTPRHADFRELERRNRHQTVALVIVFLLLFCALGLGLDFVIGSVRLRDGQLAGFPFLTIIALLVGSIQSLLSYYGGAALVLASVHARQLAPDSPKHQMVLDVLQEMALASRMPAPRAYIIDDPAPNAFATGRDPQHSVICVTQGLVDEMDREELQGVLGHEMAHVRDYDIRTMMMIAVLVGGSPCWRTSSCAGHSSAASAPAATATITMAARPACSSRLRYSFWQSSRLSFRSSSQWLFRASANTWPTLRRSSLRATRARCCGR
jgi:Zn-dependent protease with chaperone function